MKVQAEYDENCRNNGIPPDFVRAVGITHFAPQNKHAQRCSSVKDKHSKNNHVGQLIESARKYQHRSPDSLPQQRITGNIGCVQLADA